jgi:hypothetical protein
VQVPYDEGVAIHIGPESCAVAREGLGEALTGVRVGQPLSRESFLFWVPTPCIWWKATYSGASARAPGRPGVVRDPGTAGSASRAVVRLALRCGCCKKLNAPISASLPDA